MDYQYEMPHEKIKLTEINSLLVCHLCNGYLIDATAISECLHSFCRSCIIKFLEENSYCPICEVLINKAKPNLKLDKTLQDIVYKLVPGLFFNEMMRRRYFYQQYPELATRVSPEQRGEDIERTIFNPQDEISLSIEYISDDSAPGAIKVPCATKNGLDPSCTNLGCGDGVDSTIKRYLQCPGMCRVDVLKKFVRNKYQVDTNSFYIDILYKRVPLPDHYTLIDIAYIYSWKRNEPMKFFFRITDINKASDRFDYFDFTKPTVDILPTPKKIRKISRHRNSKSPRKNSHKQGKHTSHKSKHKTKNKNVEDKDVTESEECGNKALDNAEVGESLSKMPRLDSPEGRETLDKRDNNKTELTLQSNADIDKKNKENIADNKATDHPKNNFDKSESCNFPMKPEPSDGCNATVKTEINDEAKNKIQNDKSDNKSKAVYTNITLNRTNNVEIITKIQKVSNKEGQPIALNIIKHTVKKGSGKIPNSTNNVDNKPCNIETRVVPKIIIRTDVDKKLVIDERSRDEIMRASLSLNEYPKKSPEKHKNGRFTSPDKSKNESLKMTTEKLKNIILKSPEKPSNNTMRSPEKIRNDVPKSPGKTKAEILKSPIPYVNLATSDISKKDKTSKKAGEVKIKDDHKVRQQSAKKISPVPGTSRKDSCDKSDMEKSEFFKSINLTAKVPPKEVSPVHPKDKELPASPSAGQKRKHSSPSKADKSAKRPKHDKLPTTKIILHCKVPVSTPVVSKMLADAAQKASSIAKPVDRPIVTPNSNINTKLSADLKSYSNNNSNVSNNNSISDLKSVSNHNNNNNNVTSSPDLKSLFNNCNISIPSSLSITLKEGTDEITSPIIPPVKNSIQILKLPDDDGQKNPSSSLEEIKLENITKSPEYLSLNKQDFTMKDLGLKDNGILSLQKTKLDTKPEPSRLQSILPAPVPDVPSKTSNLPKDNASKSTPKSPQSFQRIFEESIKKPDGGTKAQLPKEKASSGETSSEPANGNKKNILDIATQLYKKTKLEMEKRHDKPEKHEINAVKAEEKLEKLPNITSGKISVPKAEKEKDKEKKKKKPKYEPPKFELLANNCDVGYANLNLHSNALGLNYSVSVGPKNVLNGNNSPLAAAGKFKPDEKFKPSTVKPEEKVAVDPRETKDSTEHKSNVSRDNVKSKQLEKISSLSMPDLGVEKNNSSASMPNKINKLKSETGSPKVRSPLSSPKSYTSSLNKTNNGGSSSASSKLQSSTSKIDQHKVQTSESSSRTSSPKLSSFDPLRVSSPRGSPKASSGSSKKSSEVSSSSSAVDSSSVSSQLLEKYKIQNLAQLTASFNFNAGNLNVNNNTQLAALQQAMFLKHIEMQNRQNWFNMNQSHGNMVQYENYLKSLNQNNQLLGNIKEN